MTTIAFLGLGQMGAPMASNLLQKGHRVTVYDVDKSSVNQLVDKGAQAATTPAEAAADYPVVNLPLTSSVYFKNGNPVRNSGTRRRPAVSSLRCG
jgi:4-hydroxybutyrate dehydrogenase/sulfolactaldehyde 3-reductase